VRRPRWNPHQSRQSSPTRRTAIGLWAAPRYARASACLKLGGLVVRGHHRPCDGGMLRQSPRTASGRQARGCVGGSGLCWFSVTKLSRCADNRLGGNTQKASERRSVCDVAPLDRHIGGSTPDGCTQGRRHLCLQVPSDHSEPLEGTPRCTRSSTPRRSSRPLR
jgi:hypothetical protein